jgi:hypothetical protein
VAKLWRQWLLLAEYLPASLRPIILHATTAHLHLSGRREILR